MFCCFEGVFGLSLASSGVIPGPCSAVLGSASELENKIYRDMAGRIARLRQLKCSHFDAVYALTVDFMEIWLLGHSFCSIYNAWARMPLHDTYYRAGLLALTHLKRSGFKKLSAQKVSMVRGSASSSLAPTRFCICGCEKGVWTANNSPALYCNECAGLLSLQDVRLS